MAAPKGNQFWKQRAKHGRDKLFETPELLEEACCVYFQWCDDNPFYKSEQKRGNTTFKIDKESSDSSKIELPDSLIHIPTIRPYTITGLCVYLGVNTQYFRDFKKGLDIDSDEKDKDFSLVITRVEEIIYTQKFEGAVVGAFNANIIARDLGLTDKKETTVKGLDLGTAFSSKYEN